MNIPSKLLLGRFLTRAGDQAWDFAVPLVLLKIFPDQLRIAAFYYFMVRLITVLSLPKLATLIDKISRLKTARIGISLQLIGVLLGTASIFIFLYLNTVENYWSNYLPVINFVILVIGGVLSTLGSNFMDIAIANDLVPATISGEDLSKFNSRLRQIDLFTEVVAPVLAGILLILNDPVLLGFSLIATWNVVSFFPELGLLQSVFKSNPDLVVKPTRTSPQLKQSILNKLTSGWRAFFKQPIAPVAIAYAFLWLSVLSPHGVLLAAFLTDGWQLQEWTIGTFRGAGAFFGLSATLLFPIVIKKWGLINGTRNFIIYQSVTLLIALGFFFSGGSIGQIGFLIFILFSRVGLYGFSLGEMQIRQTGIPASVRGEVNGFATALTGLATLFLFAAASLIPSTEDFKILVVGSVGCVLIACLVYLYWMKSDLTEY